MECPYCRMEIEVPITCKDCKHSDRQQITGLLVCKRLEFAHVIVTESDYCSWAERGEENGE